MQVYFTTIGDGVNGLASHYFADKEDAIKTADAQNAKADQLKLKAVYAVDETSDENLTANERLAIRKA